MTAKQLLKKHYNLRDVTVSELHGGFRNLCYKVETQSDVYVFIIYRKDEPHTKQLIQDAHAVAQFLDQKGFPARIPIKTINSLEYIHEEFNGKKLFLALYTFLPGNTVPWEAYTRRHLKSIGKTLSDMHFAFAKIKSEKLRIKNFPSWKDITKKEIDEMVKYFEEVEPWIEKKLDVVPQWEKIKNTLSRIIKDSKDQPNSILHYDFTRGNVLFGDDLDTKRDIYPITGIIDFEKVCFGPIIADIARTLAFLIIDCKYKKEATVRKRFLVSGYERRGENTLTFDPQDSDLLEDLLNFFWLRDFWSFLKYNPYEYLYMNEHYIRTRDQLMKTGLICLKLGI